MLCNPAIDKPAVIPGTRLLESPLGIAGETIADPLEPWRIWQVQWVLAPVPGRRLNGIRAKLIDTKGFITFCNQRDLEVMLHHGKPGDWCQWANQRYVSPDDKEWFGMCCDEEDLRDDLFEHECRLRQTYAGYSYLPQGLEYHRRVHLEANNDVEELHTLLWDMNPDTFQYPDPVLQRVSRRWSRIERNRLIWERL